MMLSVPAKFIRFYSFVGQIRKLVQKMGSVAIWFVADGNADPGALPPVAAVFRFFSMKYGILRQGLER